MYCTHENFESRVEVHLAEDGRRVATLALRCQQCKELFYISGLKKLGAAEAQFFVAASTEVAPGSSHVGWKSG